MTDVHERSAGANIPQSKASPTLRESHSVLSFSCSSFLLLWKNRPASTCDITRNLKPSFSAALPPPWLLPHLLPSPQPLTETLYDTLLGCTNRPALPFFSTQNTSLIRGICHTGHLHCSAQSSQVFFPGGKWLDSSSRVKATVLPRGLATQGEDEKTWDRSIVCSDVWRGYKLIKPIECRACVVPDFSHQLLTVSFFYAKIKWNHTVHLVQRLPWSCF